MKQRMTFLPQVRGAVDPMQVYRGIPTISPWLGHLGMVPLVCKGNRTLKERLLFNRKVVARCVSLETVFPLFDGQTTKK